MKKIKFFILLGLFGMISIGVNAYDFKVDGIYYKITSTTNKTVSVTYEQEIHNGSTMPPDGYYFQDLGGSEDWDYVYWSSDYSGSINIPPTVYYNGTSYSVTGVTNYAFASCSNVTSITLPSSVNVLGICAFAGCTAKLTLNGYYLQSTAEYVGYTQCTCLSDAKLSEIVFGEGVTTITGFYFGGDNPKIISIPSTLTSIDADFGDAVRLKTVNVASIQSWFKINFANSKSNPLSPFNNGMTSIPRGVKLYYNKSELINITIPSTIYKINDYALYGYDCLKSISLPNTIESIGGYAFANCSSLTSVTIPNSVTSIASSAFNSCSGLTSVAVESNNTFYDSRDNCNAIIETTSNTLISGCKNTTIPNSVTTIGTAAFSNCSGLPSVTIPNSVTSIKDMAFAYCSGLTSVTIPNSVTSIGWYVFDDCYTLRRVYVGWKDADKIPSLHTSKDFPYSTCDLYVPAGTKAMYQSKDHWKTFKNIIEYVPESPNIEFVDAKVKAICVTNWDTNDDGELSEAEAAAVTDLGTVFKDNIEITSFNEFKYFIGVTSIGENAFENCSGLTSIEIPNSVTSIGGKAFHDCSSLTSVIIPNSVTSIGYYAFHGCSGLTSMTIGNSVTSIGTLAFCFCCNLTSVIIPNSVTEIGGQAFHNCSGLTSIVVESGNTVYDSRENCNAIIETASNMLISGCKNTIIPNSVTSIGQSAFYMCSGLTSVTIPNSVTEIGHGAFVGCSGLTSIVVESGNTVYDSRENCNAIIETASNMLISGCKNTTIPNSVTSIEGFAFQYCFSLTNITIPNSVTSIGEYAFHNSGLKNVTIPNSVTSIGISAFTGCGDLTSLTIPNSVTEIGKNAFDYCSGLTSFYVGWKDADKIPSLSTSSYFPYSTCYLYVPAGAKEIYQSKDFWNAFHNIIEYNPTYDNMLLTDDINGFVGETCVLPVKMNNAVEISAVQFDLCLPEGITIAQDEDGFDLVELGERSTARKHNTIETSVQPDGAVRVMCASSKNLTFDGSEGTILYITLNVASNMTDGEYVIKMKDVVLSTASSTGYEQPLFASKIKVSSYEMGDLNKDHNINVIDYTAMCSMIMGTDGGKYPLELADFSGNGKVDVTDLTALVNKIMSSTASAAKPEIIFRAKSAVAPDVNRLSLIPFTINPGETKEISLQMFNTAEICAYQTDLVLPEGIEVVKDDGFYMVDISTERTSAKRHNTMEAELQGDGSIRIMCASTKNLTFNGNEGEVAVITIKASETLEPGVYEIQLKNNVLSTAESSGFEPADCESSVLVGSPEIASLNLNGDFTAKAIGEYNTALASNTKVAAMDFCNATSIDAATKVVTGNKNLLVYVAEGMSIANEDNAVIGDECANLVLTDGYAFCAPKEFTAAKASYTRAATNGLGTLCLPFAAKSVVGSLYELTSAESNKLTFTPVEEAKANTPYLYKSESSVIEETNATVEADAECEIVQGEWTMTGAYSTNVFGSEDNVFALYDGKLYKNTGTLTVNPFRAYFTTTESASKAEILIDTPTGISNINPSTSSGQAHNENYYNLNGVRVGKGYRGIVIKNGEKFIMK